MTDVNDTIYEIVSEFDKFQKEFQKKAQSTMKRAFKEFFDENPRISQVYWTQYTPHFNDGDECVFRLNEMYASVKDIEADEGDYIEDRANVFSSGGRWSDDEFNKEYKKEIKNFAAFTKAINKLPDTVFEATFGNHIEVTATPAGFEVEEYDHD